MDLDRQELPPPRASEPPQRVPELRPPLLGDWFIYLSVIVLFCGVIAITALELGNSLDSGIVRFPAIIGAAILALVAADAAMRTYRSIWAWWHISRGRALQRAVWTVVLACVALGSLGLIAYLVIR
ncbi:MAG: hypothetical protein QOJ81_1343 [Chloroflexota bacterium]|nr:hypothetical protein [Chloroflexota bacterium]